VSDPARPLPNRVVFPSPAAECASSHPDAAAPAAACSPTVVATACRPPTPTCPPPSSSDGSHVSQPPHVSEVHHSSVPAERRRQRCQGGGKGASASAGPRTQPIKKKIHQCQSVWTGAALVCAGRRARPPNTPPHTVRSRGPLCVASCPRTKDTRASSSSPLQLSAQPPGTSATRPPVMHSPVALPSRPAPGTGHRRSALIHHCSMLPRRPHWPAGVLQSQCCAHALGL